MSGCSYIVKSKRRFPWPVIGPRISQGVRGFGSGSRTSGRNLSNPEIVTLHMVYCALMPISRIAIIETSTGSIILGLEHAFIFFFSRSETKHLNFCCIRSGFGFGFGTNLVFYIERIRAKRHRWIQRHLHVSFMDSRFIGSSLTFGSSSTVGFYMKMIENRRISIRPRPVLRISLIFTQRKRNAGLRPRDLNFAPLIPLITFYKRQWLKTII